MPVTRGIANKKDQQKAPHLFKRRDYQVAGVFSDVQEEGKKKRDLSKKSQKI